MFSPTAEAVVELNATDPEVLAGQLRDLAAERGRLDAAEAEVLATIESLRARGHSLHHRDAAATLRLSTGIAGHTARTRAQVARALAALPSVRDSLARGAIGFDHARVFADHADSPNRDNLLDQVEEILGWALETPADRFRERLNAWAADLDEQRHPDETPSRRRHRRRRLFRGRTGEGGSYTRFELGDEGDALVQGTLRDIVSELRKADASLPVHERRSSERLFADAMVEMAHRSRGADAVTKHRARPTILALTEMSVLWDQMRVRGWCRFDDGRVLSARDLRRMACEADIIPMVLDSDGICLDMGDTVRLATYKQRLALRALHATCAVEGCDVAFAWCEIHHLRPWARVKLTNLDNLVPLCSYHHHWVHDVDPQDGDDLFEVLPDRVLRLRRLPMRPAPLRRDERDLTMGAPPPDLAPDRR